MPSLPMPRILLVGDPPSNDLRGPLEAAGFPVTAVSLSKLDLAEVARAQLVILDVAPAAESSVQAQCRRWRIELGEKYVPILWIGTDSAPAIAAAALDAGADVRLPRPVAPAHVLAQAKALLRVEHVQARLAGRAAEAHQVNERLQQAYQQIDNDLELTRQIHRSSLPRNLPDVHKARFAVCYRPRSRVGGDFYDVLRLDEDHVGLYVADAMGRGLPTTSLLSLFIKKNMRVKEISGRSYRLVSPAEVLDALNREIVGLSLPDPPFVTMLYAQLNCRDGSLSFARAAHPLPLHVPVNGALEYWPAAGSFLGVFDAHYPGQSKQLRPGDKMLIASDGVRSEAMGEAPPIPDWLIESAGRHRAEPLQAFLDSVSRELLECSRTKDDFTLLGVEFQ
jgi:sigma-B regulation protein RsbU (phosphoserine phosphatase)